MGKISELNRLLTELSKYDFKDIQAAGWHFQRNDYYSPLNDIGFLQQNPDLWTLPVEPPCIDWNIEGQMAIAEEVAAFVGELKNVPDDAEEPGQFCWNNNMWNSADAVVQYGLLRSRQPKRYLEIGCGWSSMLMRDALKLNQKKTEVTLIEPYPNETLFPHLPSDWTIHSQMLQKADSKIFEQLEAGDILFYDGSHCAKMGSDVNYFFFNVLPQVKQGVIIHIHDLFFPLGYPKDWILNRGQTWNEQFVLQAFLMHNTAYKTLIANTYLAHYKPDFLKGLYGSNFPYWGASYWMEKVSM